MYLSNNIFHYSGCHMLTFSEGLVPCDENNSKRSTAFPTRSGVGAVKMMIWPIELNTTGFISRGIRRTSPTTRCSPTKRKRLVQTGKFHKYYQNNYNEILINLLQVQVPVQWSAAFQDGRTQFGKIQCE
jgi:hypothetical protein